MIRPPDPLESLEAGVAYLHRTDRLIADAVASLLRLETDRRATLTALFCLLYRQDPETGGAPPCGAHPPARELTYDPVPGPAA